MAVAASESEPLLGAQGRDNERHSDESRGLGNEESGLLDDEADSSPVGLKTREDVFPFAEIGSSIYALFVAGLIAATLGALLPQLEEYYNLSDLSVSVIFLCHPFGYFTAAFVTRPLHNRIGRRGAVAIAPICQLIYTLTASQGPPFPLLLISLTIGGFFGLMDGSIYSWVGPMSHAKTIIGLLHGAFSLGASLGPFLATTITSVAHKPWYYWYFVLSSFVVIELVCMSYSYRRQNAKEFHRENSLPINPESEDNDQPKQSSSAFSYPATWVGSAFVFAFMGMEFTVTGWSVAYMNRVMEGPNLLGGISVSLFHFGLAVGKLSLGLMTKVVPVRILVTAFLCLAVVSQVVFALSKIPELSVAMMGVLGFLLGPMYPSGIIMLTQLLPREVQVSAISFVNSMGQVGAAFLPFVFGGISNQFGIHMLVYYICLQVVLTIPIWLCFFRLQ